MMKLNRIFSGVAGLLLLNVFMTACALPRYAGLPNPLAGTVVTNCVSADVELKYYVCYPSGYRTGDRLPLLILFSPGGAGERIADRFREAADQNNWIVAGCDGFKNRMSEELAIPRFQKMLPDLEARVPHDPDLVYMGGMSGGGWRAYNYSVHFDRPWKGIIACGGWLGGPDYDELRYPEGMSIAIVNGDKDQRANKWIDHDRQILEETDCMVNVFHFDGGHTIGPTSILDEAMKWLVSQQ